jgi:hypothetical protein
MFAPKVEGFEPFEYVVWLLSDHSTWLPENVREVLISGTIDWPGWMNGKRFVDSYDGKGLFHALLHTRSPRTFKFTKHIRASLDSLVEEALRALGLQADVGTISDAFIRAGYVKGYFKVDAERRAGR